MLFVEFRGCRVTVEGPGKVEIAAADAEGVHNTRRHPMFTVDVSLGTTMTKVRRLIQLCFMC